MILANTTISTRMRRDVDYRCYCETEPIMYWDLITHIWLTFVGQIRDMKYLITKTVEQKLSYMIEINENIELSNNDNNKVPNSLIKKGVKIPTCEPKWKQSNKCFKTNIHQNDDMNDIKQEVDILQVDP